jgi:hypothetical protein
VWANFGPLLLAWAAMVGGALEAGKTALVGSAAGWKDPACTFGGWALGIGMGTNSQQPLTPARVVMRLLSVDKRLQLLLFGALLITDAKVELSLS